MLLYVDDMMLVAKDMSEVQELKNELSSVFDMKDLGPARRILGMDIVKDIENEILYLSQFEYLKNVIRSFRMENAKSSLTPIGAHFKLSKIKDQN